jgi:hypothetical protein
MGVYSLTKVYCAEEEIDDGGGGGNVMSNEAGLVDRQGERSGLRGVRIVWLAC